MVAPATRNRELATLRSAVAWWRPRLAGHRPHRRPRAAPGAPRPDPEPSVGPSWRPCGAATCGCGTRRCCDRCIKTAARASEALNLNLEDLELANKRAQVTSKGGRSSGSLADRHRPTPSPADRRPDQRPGVPSQLSTDRPRAAGDLDSISGRGLVASMGTVGDALDNAGAESFFVTLKCELLDHHHYPGPPEPAAHGGCPAVRRS